MSSACASASRTGREIGPEMNKKVSDLRMAWAQVEKIRDVSRTFKLNDTFRALFI